MPLVQKKLWSDDEIDAALVLTDTLLFALNFWADELTIAESRTDLPAIWRGKQVVSKEQRMMALAGSDYMILRHDAPWLAIQSSQKIAFRTSRKIAKTIIEEARMLQIPLLHTLSTPVEGMIHTPGDRQMAPLIDRYEKKIRTVRLFKIMHKSFNHSDGVDNWYNGFTWFWRIEGAEARAGYAMIGLRASYMLGDEADYAGDKAYQERKQTALPGCSEVWAGVPRGVRGIFWAECRNPNSGWQVFRFDMRANPIYHSEQAWAEQVSGEWNSQRVQTQVLGKDGEVAVSSFPVIPVDSTLPFVARNFSVLDYEADADNLAQLVQLPMNEPVTHLAESWIIYMDYGYSPSPAEIGVAYYRRGVWFTLGRFEVRQVDPSRMAMLLHVLDQQVLPRPASVIALDAHGQGFGVLSALQQEERYAAFGYGERAIDVGFASTAHLPGLFAHKKCGQRVRTEGDERQWKCDYCHEQIYSMNDLREATLPMKTYLTDELKNGLSWGQRWLETGTWPNGMAIVMGHDLAAIDELTGTTEVQRPGGSVMYLPPQEGMDHITDHFRCMTSAALRFSSMQHGGTGAGVEEFGWFDPGFGISEMGWR